MTALPQSSVAALEPVRRFLRATAQAQAAEIRRAAEQQARAILAAAADDAERIRAAAEAEGEAAARSDAALRSARVRRQAHEGVLAAQESVRQELLRQLSAAAAGLRSSSPRYPELLQRLTERSRVLLGPRATVTESADGGVIAEEGSRRLDLTLPVLAVHMLESRLAQVRELWTG
jgi:cell division septum initiation protein DivIVA